MSKLEFIDLHATCNTARETYFAEAKKTSAMLRNCTAEPLSFRDRFALLSQEIVEKDAGLLYLEAKRLMHSAALLGYAVLRAPAIAARTSPLRSR